MLSNRDDSLGELLLGWRVCHYNNTPKRDQVTYNLLKLKLSTNRLVRGSETRGHDGDRVALENTHHAAKTQGWEPCSLAETGGLRLRKRFLLQRLEANKGERLGCNSPLLHYSTRSCDSLFENNTWLTRRLAFNNLGEPLRLDQTIDSIFERHHPVLLAMPSTTTEATCQERS